MDIYSLSGREIREKLYEFGKTYYGKIQFILSYILPIVSFIVMIILLCMCPSVSECKKITFYWIFLGVTFFNLISFVIGSIHYYTELRYFCYRTKK